MFPWSILIFNFTLYLKPTVAAINDFAASEVLVTLNFNFFSSTEKPFPNDQPLESSNSCTGITNPF